MHPQSARESCSFFLERLSVEIDRLRERPFPGHDIGPRKWLNFIEGLVDTGGAFLTESAKPGQTDEAALSSITWAEHLGDLSYRLMQHVVGADATQIPHQIVAPFLRIVKQLGITNTIFFRAEHVPNYELGRYGDNNQAFLTLAHVTPKLVKAIADINWPVMSVTVPGHAMGMLPHFAVVGHELGHAIQDQIDVDYTPISAAFQKFNDRLVDRLTKLNIAFDTKTKVHISGIFKNWENEIKADAIGYALGGPSFFFALCGFIQLSRKSYGLGGTHPPTDVRRRLLVQQMGDGTPNFRAVLKDKTGLDVVDDVNSPGVPRCPDADKLFNDIVPKLKELDAAICSELVELIESMGSLIYAEARKFIQSTCPELLYAPTQLETDLTNHLDDLCDLIPPIETRHGETLRPTSLYTILNVGWAALLTRLDKIAGPQERANDDPAGKMERLHELLLKATELSEARRLWEETK